MAYDLDLAGADRVRHDRHTSTCWWDVAQARWVCPPAVPTQRAAEPVPATDHGAARDGPRTASEDLLAPGGRVPDEGL